MKDVYVSELERIAKEICPELNISFFSDLRFFAFVMGLTDIHLRFQFDRREKIDVDKFKEVVNKAIVDVEQRLLWIKNNINRKG